MIARIKAYWQSRQSNVHGLVLFLGGTSGICAMKLMHVPEHDAQFVAGACMVLGALLYTPGNQ